MSAFAESVDHMRNVATTGRVPVEGFADIVAKVAPAVVSVKTETTQESSSNFRQYRKTTPVPPNSPFWPFFKNFPFGPDEGEPEYDGPNHNRPYYNRPPAKRHTGYLGSGFIVSEDGYIVTNNHVIENAEKITISTSDGKTYKGKIIGADPRTDLAVLKIDAKDSLPYLKFSKSTVRVGDWVIAIGNPFGLGGTVTTGIVSARGREIGGNSYDDFLQIDAPINHGNSGGPALNIKGEVIGVNTAIYTPSGGNVGIGFAIPASTASRVVEDLIKTGKVTRGWLGVSIQNVTEDIAESLGLGKPSGALVLGVWDDSPAEKAGFETGDTILAVNEDTIKNASDLSRKIGQLKPGSEIEIEILRDGQRKTLNVTIAEMQGGEATLAHRKTGSHETSLSALGLAVASSRDGKGVVIVDIDPDGSAASKGLNVGDRIMEVSGHKVNSPEELRDALDKVEHSKRKAVLFLVRNSQGQRFVAVPLREK
ncbi:MAG: Do family serine endopeptidase [Hyphomicrobiales bacterium]